MHELSANRSTSSLWTPFTKTLARSIIEHALLDIMFDLPSLSNVQKVVVDDGSISGDGKPLLIYSDQPKVAGGQQ